MPQGWGSGKSWIQEPRTPPHAHGGSGSDSDKASGERESVEKPGLGRGR